MAKKSSNSSLTEAKSARYDEYYTQFSDIEKELKHYKQHFKGKVVFCNCDDPYESNFFKYFALNFNHLELKRLICTCYDSSPFAGEQLSLFDVKPLMNSVDERKKPYKVIINEIEDINKDSAVDLVKIETLLKNKKNVLTLLEGSGDFRSAECIELLKQSDIVVTNPPFSLFREYISQLIDYDKRFVIIGNKNSLSYKECFQLIKENKLWIGVTPMSTDMLFDVTKEYGKVLIEKKKQGSGYKIVDGKVKARAQAIWFTNIDNKKRHEELILYKKFDPDYYPKFDNYDAINVNATKEIPYDYDGYMGVPITFLDKYNPVQFEIVSSNDRRLNINVPYKDHGLIKDKDGTINGIPTYVRIVIKNKRL